VAQKLLTPLTIKNLSSPGSDAVTVFVNGEAYGRLRIEAGGRMSWSDGTGNHDTNLYRESADTLTTDDIFKALTALVSPITSGVPSANVPNGAIAVDNLNNRLYFRSNSTWRVVQGGATVSANAPDSPLEGALWFDTDDNKLYIRQGNAWVLAGGSGSSVTVSDNEPASPSVGNLWYESDTGKMFIYYDSFWVEVSGDTGPQGPAGPAGPALNTQNIRIAVAGAGEIETLSCSSTTTRSGLKSAAIRVRKVLLVRLALLVPRVRRVLLVQRNLLPSHHPPQPRRPQDNFGLIPSTATPTSTTTAVGFKSLVKNHSLRTSTTCLMSPLQAQSVDSFSNTTEHHGLTTPLIWAHIRREVTFRVSLRELV